MVLTTSRHELLVDGDDAEFRQLVHDILAFGARIHEVRAQFGTLIGLAGTAYTILISVEHLGARGPVSIGCVSEHLHLSGPFVTIEVGKLIEHGLLEKRQSAEDRRRVELTVSIEGKRRLAKLSHTQVPVNDTIFASLGREDFDRLRQMMAQLIDGAGEALALCRLHIEQQRRKA